MKRQLLLGLSLLLSAGFAKAQWTNQAGTWSYGFNTSTPGTTSSSGTAATYLSTDATPVLAPPSSGTAMVYFAAGSGASVTLNGTNDLVLVPVSGVSKVSFFGLSNATELAYSKFTLTFGRTGTTAPANNTAYIWSIGNRGATGNLYSNSNAVNNASTADNSIFTALRFLYNATNANYVLGYRSTTTSTGSTYTTLTNGAFTPDIPYTFEVYANNSSVAKTYTKSATVYTVAPGSFHVWATNNTSSAVSRPSISGNFDIPKSVETVSTTGDKSILAGTSLNSFLFQGSANTSGYSKVTITGNLELAYNETTLPVNLTSFTGKKAANGVTLNWSTASEENNDYFAIARSTDGQSFSTIKTVKGKGTTSEMNSYSFTDNLPAVGTNYYQLSQVDKDGTTTVFKDLVAINYELSGDKFAVYASGDKLNVSAYAEKAGSATLSVFDLQGKKVYAITVRLSAGQNAITVDAGNIGSGIFVANLVGSEAAKSVKFTKK